MGNMIPRPTTLDQLHGIKKQKEICQAFLKDFQDKVPGHKNAILLHGHRGTGKSTLVECMANDYKYPIYEVNGSEVRTRDQLREISKYTTVTPKTMKHCIIHIDEVDGLSNVKDKNKEAAIDVLYEIIKKTKHPIFLTANDDWPLRKLNDIVIKVQFYRHKPDTISNVLRQYTNDEQKIYEITQYCDGDIRAALSMVESIAQKTFSDDSVFFVVDNLLQHKEIDGKVDMKNEKFIWWMEENIQHRLLGVSFLHAYQHLCHASRLLRESSKYSRLLMTENVGIVSHFKRNGYIKVLPPSFNARIFDAEKHKKTIVSLAGKLPFHTFKAFESDILPLLINLGKNKEWLKLLFHQHNLTQGELALVMNVPYDDIAVTSFIADADAKTKQEPVAAQTQIQTKLSMNVYEV